MIVGPALIQEFSLVSKVNLLYVMSCHVMTAVVPNYVCEKAEERRGE